MVAWTSTNLHKKNVFFIKMNFVKNYIYGSGSKPCKSNGLVVREADFRHGIARSNPAVLFRNFQGQDIVGSIPVAFFLFYMYILKKKR
jgi:hypothetical protein